MNVLSIGNSFSQDAQRYLHRIAAADGVSLHTFNLYIGGCSLAQHYQNMLSRGAVYTLEMNGESTGFKVGLEQALLNREWDVVTLQQVSHQAPHYETYRPYLEKLVEYVRLCVPKAKIVLHQTWSYEQGSDRLCRVVGYGDNRDMLLDIQEAYHTAAQETGAELTIPSGELFDALLENGMRQVHRDTFHASLGAGRYALGLLWYRFLTGQEVADNSFNDPDEEVSSEQIDLIKRCVARLADQYQV